MNGDGSHMQGMEEGKLQIELTLVMLDQKSFIINKIPSISFAIPSQKWQCFEYIALST